MHYQEFYYWCRDAVSKIKYTPDRDKVYTELYTHLEDRYESFLAKGLSAKEAEQKALAAMGDAKELAPQLAAIHKPHWAYAMHITRFFACVLILATVISAAVFSVKDLQNGNWQAWFNDSWDPFTEGNGTRIAYVTPKDVTDSTDGYYFKVKRAALWHRDDASRDQLYVRLDVSNLLPWMIEVPALDHMWAVDSAGTYYASRQEQNPTTQAWIVPISDGQGLWTHRYDIYFQGTPANIEWVELHYDRDGRDILLRIDLIGGGT